LREINRGGRPAQLEPEQFGIDVIGNSPDEFAAVIKSEIPKWAKLIKESGIKPN
jgi:tripartite-type tricarboxylate transporter receptor subunit TctC